MVFHNRNTLMVNDFYEQKNIVKIKLTVKIFFLQFENAPEEYVNVLYSGRSKTPPGYRL